MHSKSRSGKERILAHDHHHVLLCPGRSCCPGVLRAVIYNHSEYCTLVLRDARRAVGLFDCFACLWEDVGMHVLTPHESRQTRYDANSDLSSTRSSSVPVVSYLWTRKHEEQRWRKRLVLPHCSDWSSANRAGLRIPSNALLGRSSVSCSSPMSRTRGASSAWYANYGHGNTPAVLQFQTCIPMRCPMNSLRGIEDFPAPCKRSNFASATRF